MAKPSDVKLQTPAVTPGEPPAPQQKGSLVDRDYFARRDKGQGFITPNPDPNTKTPAAPAMGLGLEKPRPQRPRLGYEAWANDELGKRLANRKKIEYGGRHHRRRGETDEDVTKKFWAEAEDLYAQQSKADPEFTKKWESRANMEHVRTPEERKKWADYEAGQQGGGQEQIAEEDSTIDTPDEEQPDTGMDAVSDEAPQPQPSAAPQMEGPEKKPEAAPQLPAPAPSQSVPRNMANASGQPSQSTSTSTTPTSSASSVTKLPKMGRNRKLAQLESKLGNLYK